MRVTSVFKRLLDLPGITVTDVQFSADAVVRMTTPSGPTVLV